MSISPIITFKAGQCEIDTSSKPHKVSPIANRGYIYLYSDDDLIHFCWRERNAHLENPELDLVMVPTDGHFQPYEYTTSNQPTSKTNGRIFALKFSSSSQRHLFWMQSKPQSRNGDPSWFSPRDLKIGQIVDSLLQGEEVDVTNEITQIQGSEQRHDDEDDPMEDIEGTGDSSQHHGGSGGAGPGATGGDIREEGEHAREGGADGGRAAAPGTTDAAIAVQNFLNSLKGSQSLGSGGRQQAEAQLYTTLPDLLPTSTTIPMLHTLSSTQLDALLAHLPPSIILMSQNLTGTIAETFSFDGGQATALASLTDSQKKSILERVLRSPQFHQSLGSLTVALRDGGLPSMAGALKINVANGGFMRRGGMPLGGGDAVEAFVEGVKKTVEDANGS